MALLLAALGILAVLNFLRSRTPVALGALVGGLPVGENPILARVYGKSAKSAISAMVYREAAS